MTRKELMLAIETIIDETPYTLREGEFVVNTDDAALEIVNYLENNYLVGIKGDKVLDIFTEM